MADDAAAPQAVSRLTEGKTVYAVVTSTASGLEKQMTSGPAGRGFKQMRMQMIVPRREARIGLDTSLLPDRQA